MKKSEIRRYEMLVRVRNFGASHAGLFPETSLAAKAFDGVDKAVTELSAHAVAEASALTQGRASGPSARRVLLDALQEIVRTARVIKAGDPAFNNTFHLPRRQPSQALLAAGRSFADAAEPVAAQFVAHELPQTFLADLSAKVDALALAIEQRDARKDARTAARVHYGTTIEAGLTEVHKLDVLVPNRLKDDPATLAVWQRDRRIERSHAKAAVVTETSPVAAPVTALVPKAA